jgi:thiamine pyrophosphate-dependent acetolactate synthase large subunit-like protein
VTNAEEIPRIVAYAFRSANAGIKGPVLLDFPIDVLFSPPQQHRISYGAIDVAPAAPPGPDPAAVDRLLASWKSAKRPVIITGTGARGTDKILTKLAEATNTPVFYSNKFSTPIPSNHELRGGPATGLAALAGQEPADFVLLLAARTGFLLGGRSGAIISNDSTIAQVDLDGSEIGKSHAVHIGITSDATLFCEAVVGKISTTPLDRHDSWIKTCRALTTSPLPYEEDAKVQKDGQLHPFHALSAVMNSLPRDSIIMVDGGEAGQWACMTLEQAKPHVAIVATGYLGFLGNGWGYSIGAAVADPSRLVVNIHGDGSAGFHIQELDTISRHGLKILTVVVNNYVWGMSINGQDLLYKGQTSVRPAVHLSKSCNYVRPSTLNTLK